MGEKTPPPEQVLEALTIEELSELASRSLSEGTREFLNGGAGTNQAVARNVEAWSNIRLLPKTLQGLERIDTSLTIQGTTFKAPIGMAPIGSLGSLSNDGENALFYAGKQPEYLPIVASHSSTPFRDISGLSGSAWWFQLYLHQSRDDSIRLLEEAVAYGASAVVFTVDLPVVGYRDGARKHAQSLAESPLPGQHNSIYPNLRASQTKEPPPEHVRLWDNVLDASISKQDLTWLIRRCDVPVYVKGVLRADEAAEYMRLGAAGIIVSNHGGRALEAAPATASQVAPIRDAIGPSAPLLVDGGIRRGDDIARALCLGATMVLVGRPYAWGLAAGGSEGLKRSLDILWNELRITMALLGVQSIDELNEDLLFFNG